MQMAVRPSLLRTEDSIASVTLSVLTNENGFGQIALLLLLQHATEGDHQRINPMVRCCPL